MTGVQLRRKPFIEDRVNITGIKVEYNPSFISHFRSEMQVFILAIDGESIVHLPFPLCIQSKTFQ